MPKRTDIKKIMTVPLVMLIITSVAFLCLPSVQANTCVAIPPTKISGAFCGRVVDVSGGIETDGELRVVDKDGAVISHTSVNAQGDFKFPALPKGSYRLMTTAKGFRDYVGDFVILRPNQNTCSKPTTVVLGIHSCEGGIGKDKPPHFHEPGW